MKNLINLCAAAFLTFGIAGTVAAEQWVDYTPAKGVTVVTSVHVEPSRIDDYLVGLKKTWVPSQEIAKKHGLVDYYFVQVAVNANTGGPNVMLGVHYVSMASFDPVKDRDLAMNQEFEKVLPKAEGVTVQAERGKYRAMVGEEMWAGVDFTK